MTQKEIAAVITHAAFYAGWPKAWAVFNLAKEVWETGEGDLPYEEEAMRAHAKEMVFPIGAPNDGFAQYFSGRSFLAPISTFQVGIFNVTFEPGCRNNWHIHHAKSGGGQILVCVAGRGFYQEEGRDAVEMKPGDCINIPVDVKHWHGAAPDEWFSHRNNEHGRPFYCTSGYCITQTFFLRGDDAGYRGAERYKDRSARNAGYS